MQATLAKVGDLIAEAWAKRAQFVAFFTEQHSMLVVAVILGLCLVFDWFAMFVPTASMIYSCVLVTLYFALRSKPGTNARFYLYLGALFALFQLVVFLYFSYF